MPFALIFNRQDVHVSLTMDPIFSLAAYRRALTDRSDAALTFMLQTETCPERRIAIEAELDGRNPSPWAFAGNSITAVVLTAQEFSR